MTETVYTSEGISGRYIEPTEQTQCQASKEDGTQQCPENSLYVVFDKHVEHHLCDEHLTEERNAYFRGKGGFLEGLEEGVEFEKIKGNTTSECDYYIQGPPLHHCGGRATHAKIVVDVYFLCPLHAEDMGFLIQTN